MAEQNKKIQLTAEGLKKAQNELEFLIGTERNRIAEQISFARSYGDLSENAEYDEAKNEQTRVEMRIVELEALIANCEIVEEANKDVIGMGSKVTVLNLSTNKQSEITIVGANEIDLKAQKISVESPLGIALQRHRKNDVVEVEAPKGKIKYQVISID